jgi:hypothetical protein
MVMAGFRPNSGPRCEQQMVARGDQEGEGTMPDTARTPNIAVTIGREMKLYHAFVTTAPRALDGPSTVTLYASTLAEVGGFAAEPPTYDAARATSEARLVLIDATELAWHRARYRGGSHVCVPADPVLVGRNTLQHWLWQRLYAFDATEAR